MRLTFVVERATQFEAPFFRFAAADAEHSWEVLFLDPQPGGAVPDPELGRSIDWGFDRLAGYRHAVLPGEKSGRRAFLRHRFGAASPDLVIVNGYTVPAYRQVAREAHRLGIPTALRIDSTLYGETPLRRLGKRGLLVPWLLRRFDLFLAVGSASRSYLAGLGVPVDRLGRFPYAVDHDRFRLARSFDAEAKRALRRRFGLSPSGPVLLAVAKLSPRETPWDLATAGGLLADTQLLVVGDGPDRRSFEATAGASWGSRCVLAGYLPYADLTDAYATADVFIHAPREERWGVSVAEALAAGLPVVTSDRVGAAIDLILPGRNGETFPHGDSTACATAIRSALAMPRQEVQAASDAILEGWDYAASWQDLLSAARRARGRTPAAAGLRSS